MAAGVTTEKADLIFASLPYRILHRFQIPAYEAMAERDKDFYERLEASGFEHDWGDDGSGLFMKYLRRGSGYYIDVGAADLVAERRREARPRPGRPPDRGRRRPGGRHRAARRPGRLRHRLRLDERLGRRPDRPGDRRPARQGLGPRLRHHQGPRPVGGRAAQHVEADPGAEPLDARRQPPPVAALLALPRRSSSRRGSRGSTPRSTRCRRCTTPAKGCARRPPDGPRFGT